MPLNRLLTKSSAASVNVASLSSHRSSHDEKDNKPAAEGMRRAISLKNVAEALHIGSASPSKGKLTSNKSFKTLTELAGKEHDFHYELNQFDVIKQIGSGAFGKVQLCKHVRTGETVVLKIIKKQWVLDSHQLDHVKEENSTMMQLSAHDCPFVVKTLGSFQDAKNLYFVMEYVSGGELFAHLRAARHGRFSERRARFYVAELMLALKYMHEHEHIVYRDIKPENILLDEDGHLKLIDFGFAKHLGDQEKTYTFCGTPDYLAPEVIKGEGYNKEADFWGLGVFLYELLTGRAPFVTMDSHGQVKYKDILTGQFTFPKYVTQPARDLISRLLTVDRQHRLGSKHGMLDVMQHPFFKDIDWPELAVKRAKPPKRRKYKKGLVNLQPATGRPSEQVGSIDQSLFDRFDSVVKTKDGQLLAEQLNSGRLPDIPSHSSAESESDEGSRVSSARQSRRQPGEEEDEEEEEGLVFMPKSKEPLHNPPSITTTDPSGKSELTLPDADQKPQPKPDFIV